jgi:hypothetical protein
VSRYDQRGRQFAADIRRVDPTGTFVTGVRPSRLSVRDVEIVVSPEWHYHPKAIRLQLAQSLWKLWASICSPHDPDKALISLFDATGNRVGGSSSLAGSLVNVDD